VNQAVLLLAHGAPERVEDVSEYLGYVRAGRPTPPHLVKEIEERYAAIGGGSPMLARTREQAVALQAALGMPVYFGMRNWHPFLKDTLQRMRADGVERVIAVCLAPQYSKMSVGFYFRRVQEAKVELGFQAEIVWTKSFHAHPMLIEAFAEKLAPIAPGRKVLFTAHSLPEKILEGGDVYDFEARATAAAVAAHLALPDWEFAYQSQSATNDKWLGPTVESCIDRYPAGELVIAPIGFVSDHVEVLYDVEIGFRRYAKARGIELCRMESLNDSPKFIAALTDVIRKKVKQ
jgi:protoporphyrin/coproporphyrin ferrochelatase